MRRRRALRLAALAMAALMALSGCGDGPAKAPHKLEEGQQPYKIPPFQDSVFHPESAEDCGAFQLDCSGMAQGYIALLSRSDSPRKFQIERGEERYHYTVPSGEPVVLPLNLGDGTYTFRLLENVGDNRYAVLWSEEQQVTMNDEFQCFLHPSQMANYGPDSQCVRVARELAASCATDIDVAGAIYDYLVKNIRYDGEKAATVEPGYLPDPDETLTTGKGICFDYASLAAAMMRSLGIPCKLITGFVDGDVYHAWNCFYLQGQGWVTVGIQASPNSWQRVDITFAASGRSTSKLTDDGNYTTRYTY